jgi:hypothetical protein
MTQPDELTQKIQELLRSVSALAELRQQLERLVGQRVVSVQGNVSGSVIVIGDSNQITLGDGGQLADLWRDLQLDDQAAAERYRERVAALYDHLTFPLSGLSFETILKDVYQPLQAAPVSDLTRWQQAERAATDRRRETDELLADERPVALLGLQLKKLLAEEPDLLNEAARLLAIVQTDASQNRSVIIKGNVSGSVIVAGNRNKVTH